MLPEIDASVWENEKSDLLNQLNFEKEKRKKLEKDSANNLAEEKKKLDDLMAEHMKLSVHYNETMELLENQISKFKSELKNATEQLVLEMETHRKESNAIIIEENKNLLTNMTVCQNRFKTLKNYLKDHFTSIKDDQVHLINLDDATDEQLNSTEKLIMRNSTSEEKKLKLEDENKNLQETIKTCLNSLTDISAKLNEERLRLRTAEESLTELTEECEIVRDMEKKDAEDLLDQLKIEKKTSEMQARVCRDQLLYCQAENMVQKQDESRFYVDKNRFNEVLEKKTSFENALNEAQKQKDECDNNLSYSKGIATKQSEDLKELFQDKLDLGVEVAKYIEKLVYCERRGNFTDVLNV